MPLFASHFGFILLFLVLPILFPGTNFYQFTVSMPVQPALRLENTSVKVQEREFYSEKYKDYEKKYSEQNSDFLPAESVTHFTLGDSGALLFDSSYHSMERKELLIIRDE